MAPRYPLPEEIDICERHRGRRRPKGSKLKWAILALAGAVVIGLVLNKYLAT